MKSLTTDEIGLNEALAAGGVHAIETDFAELILQLDGDWSSHILVPAIHRNRTEIRDLFRAHDRRPGSRPTTRASSPRRRASTCASGSSTRAIGVSGANFGVAETGTVCVVESEGNGRMCTTLPPVLVTILGIEKLVPTLRRPRGLPAAAAALRDRRADEPVHVALDRRRPPATGRRSSTSCCSTTAARACSRDEVGRQALHCIRCSACLNVCPVYSRTGGHAYGSVYPGPIGAILDAAAASASRTRRRCRSPRASAAPATRSARSRSTSRRCSCTCGRRPSRRQATAPERALMRALAWVFGGPRRLRARAAARPARPAAVRPRRADPPAAAGRSRGWTRTRDLRPVAARELPRPGGDESADERAREADPRPRPRRRSPARRRRRPSRAATGAPGRSTPRRASSSSASASATTGPRSAASTTRELRGAIAAASARAHGARGSASRRAPAGVARRGRRARRRRRARAAPSSTASTASSPAARVAIAETGTIVLTAGPTRAAARSRSSPTSTSASSRSARSSSSCPRRSRCSPPSAARAAAAHVHLRPVGHLRHRAQPGRGRPRPAHPRRPRRLRRPMICRFRDGLIVEQSINVHPGGEVDATDRSAGRNPQGLLRARERRRPARLEACAAPTARAGPSTTPCTTRPPARSTPPRRASGTARASGAAPTSARRGRSRARASPTSRRRPRSSRRSPASPRRTAACSRAPRRRASSRAATAARRGRC